MKGGVKYIPIYVFGSISLYLLFMKVLGIMFSGIVLLKHIGAKSEKFINNKLNFKNHRFMKKRKNESRAT